MMMHEMGGQDMNDVRKSWLVIKNREISISFLKSSPRQEF